jgi:hypothetical protein
LKTPTNDGSGSTGKQPIKNRDIELENIVGNLMIAEYQIERLRSMLTEKLVGRCHGVAGYHYKKDEESVDFVISERAFQHKGKLYKMSVKVEGLTNIAPTDNSDLI